MGSANERRRYNVTSSLIGWAHTQNDLWVSLKKRRLVNIKIAQVSVKQVLTLKHRETHGCVVSTVATDALVLKHQAISIHNAD